MRHLSILTFILLSFSMEAQWLPEGTVINNFQMTDINNNVIDAYQTTATGKHIIIDFSATWCSSCLNYHNSKVLENYYKAYGPNGTIAQDAQVVFYEADFSTDNNDLIGTGTNTIADWTLGITHPICNESMPSDVFHKFLSSPGNINYPSVVVLCENNRYYRLSTTITQVAQLRANILDKCSSAPVSIETIKEHVPDFNIYLNPVNGKFVIQYNLTKPSDISVEIMSITGQRILYKSMKSRPIGKHHFEIPKLNIPSGMYFVRFNNETRLYTEQFFWK